MPTDEQRMRFEKWFTDTVLRRAPQPGQRFERDDVGGYIDPTVHDMWRGYVAGELARDAEVQALREALRKIAWLDTGENSSHSDALDALTKIEIIAFAALRGEGAGGQ